MNIEDIKIEDAADANYVIKKFFNNEFKDMKMTQLEQLVLTVYNMGKKSGVSAGGADSAVSGAGEAEPKPAAKAPVKEAPFKITDRVKILEDVQIGHSGEFVKAESEGTVSAVKGDTITVLCEAGEDGEMMEVDIMYDMLEKVT